MRILYGVVGEGMGHAMRSRVILEHLTKQGHEVVVMASGRAHPFLKRHFANVSKIHGFHMILEENRFRLGRSVVSNVVQGVTGVPENIAAYFKMIRAFSPDLVISDFESWTYIFAKTHRIPIISIDNMQALNRCTHPRAIIEGHDASFQIAKAFVKSKLPYCDHYMITTFVRPAVRKPHTTLHAPILRPEILSANVRKGDHLLVYQTGEGNSALAATLAKTKLECRVYGMRRDITAEQIEGNLRYQPFSEGKFIDDLASCRAVIAGGGFTLMGEAVYLRKPMLSVPIANQFEQIFNARYLEHVGYGKYADTLDEAAPVHHFLDAIEECEAHLAAYCQDGNEELFGSLDGLLDRAIAGVL
jgi:uncharacterized protein (TIGR00661 family)